MSLVSSLLLGCGVENATKEFTHAMLLWLVGLISFGTLHQNPQTENV
jgi:hypothetical protein